MWTRLGDLKPALTAAELVGLQEQVHAVRVDDAIIEYILSVAEATRRSEDLAVGLSPRGSLALLQASKAQALLDGRDFVVPDDVKELAVPVCAHRLLTKAFSHDGSTATAESLFQQILETVPSPQ